MNQPEFFEPIVRVASQAWQLLPRLLASLLVMVAGLMIGWILRVIVSRALALARFDRLCDRLGINTMLARGGLLILPSRLTGDLLGGLVMVVAILLSISSLDLAVTNALLDRFIQFLPNFFVAVVLFIFGMLVAKFLQRGALIALVNAQFPGARLVSGAVGVGLMVFVLAIALEQVGVGGRVVIAAFSILFGGVVVALAIAFGLAGRDLAREFLERRFRSHPEEEGDHQKLSHL